MISLLISPPATSFINSAARFNTFTALEMSTPFSNLVAASVLNPCFNDVFRMPDEAKQALSRNMFVVVADTPLFNPPNTPAMHMGALLPSHINKSSANNFLSFSSRVVNTVSGSAFFTIILFLSILSASNA